MLPDPEGEDGNATRRLRQADPGHLIGRLNQFRQEECGGSRSELEPYSEPLWIRNPNTNPDPDR